MLRCPLCDIGFASDPDTAYFAEYLINSLQVGQHLLKDHKRTVSQAVILLNRQAAGKTGIINGFGMQAIVSPGVAPGSVFLIVPPDDAFDLDEFGRWLDGALQGGHLKERTKAVLVKNIGGEVGDGDDEDVGDADRSDRRPLR